MNERLIEALLRLCDLEKQAQEQVIAGLRQDVNGHYRAENELRITIKDLHATLAEREAECAELRDNAFQVGKWVHQRLALGRSEVLACRSV